MQGCKKGQLSESNGMKNDFENSGRFVTRILIALKMWI